MTSADLGYFGRQIARRSSMNGSAKFFTATESTRFLDGKKVLCGTLLLALVILPHTLLSQQLPATMLRARLDQSMKRLVDSTTTAFTDSLAPISAEAERAVRDAMADVRTFSDSIVAAARISLRASRLDTLRGSATALLMELNMNWKHMRPDFRHEREALTGRLDRAASSIRDAWSEDDDTSDALDRITEVADSAGWSLRDSAQITMDSVLSAWLDQSEVVKDSIEALMDNLVDTEANERELEEENRSHLDLELEYDSHSTYLSRDDGIIQYALSPSVTYQHRSGFSLSAGTSWLSKTKGNWDATFLSLGYELRFSDHFGCVFGYTRFWFSENSIDVRSVFNSELSAGMSLESSVVNIGTDAAFDFSGTNSEWFFTLTVGHRLNVSETATTTIAAEPTISAGAGVQELQLVELRESLTKKKMPVSKPLTVSERVFGSMTYEFSLPVEVRIGPTMVTPSIHWIVPLNVLDSSTSHPFWKAGASLIATIR